MVPSSKPYKDEKDFTINAVIPWLKTRKDHGDVDYTGGTDEYGRDVVFSKLELGNHKIWCAVQVKDDDIKGEHKSDSGIQEIIRQAKSAMTMPYTKRGDTSKIVIQQIMIVTMGKITKNAANLIKESDDLKGRSILFYEYSDILETLRAAPMSVSKVKLLIRLKLNNTMPNDKLITELKSKGKKYGWEIYNHEPESDTFQSLGDDYIDLSFDKFFEELLETNWQSVCDLLKKIGVKIYTIAVRFYYPKVFTTKNLDDIKKRFFHSINLLVYEDQTGPCFIYKCHDFGFVGEGWIKNVNNMQIL